jgi:hypothetical protein
MKLENLNKNRSFDLDNDTEISLDLSLTQIKQIRSFKKIIVSHKNGNDYFVYLRKKTNFKTISQSSLIVKKLNK